MAPPRNDSVHYTYADYLTWPDDDQIELIDGIAFIKEPPAPARLHQELVGELYHQIRLALEGMPYRAYVAPFDVRLPRCGEPDEKIDTIVQPDVLIVCDPGKLDDRGMRGAPEWVAEVLSPTTTLHDQTVKLPIYERAGIREVWLLQPIERTLTVYRLEGTCYGCAVRMDLKGHTAISAVPGVKVDCDRLSAALA